MPVIAAGESGGVVHALLHDGPFAGVGEDEIVEVELESVGDGVVVDLGGEATGASEFVAIESGAGGDVAEFVGSATRVATTSAANVKAEFVGARIESAFERAHDAGGDAGGVPVHAHDAAEGLEPKGIADAREEF